MSKTVCHMQKWKANDIYGLFKHCLHEKDSSTNGDIDYSRRSDNQDMINHSEGYFCRPMPDTEIGMRDWRTKTNKRLKALLNKAKTNIKGDHKTLRKDAVVCNSFIFGSDNKAMHKMKREERNKYFSKCYEMMCKRYGKENIIYAVIHNNERTPHLHLGVCPMKDGRLNGKALFNRNELRQLQTEVGLIGREFGLERGVEGSQKKHISIQDYKIMKNMDLLDKVNQALIDKHTELSNLTNELLNAKMNERDLYVYRNLKKKFPKTTKDFEASFDSEMNKRKEQEQIREQQRKKQIDNSFDDYEQEL